MFTSYCIVSKIEKIIIEYYVTQYIGSVLNVMLQDDDKKNNWTVRVTKDKVLNKISRTRILWFKVVLEDELSRLLI